MQVVGAPGNTGSCGVRGNFAFPIFSVSAPHRPASATQYPCVSLFCHSSVSQRAAFVSALCTPFPVCLCLRWQHNARRRKGLATQKRGREVMCMWCYEGLGDVNLKLGVVTMKQGVNLQPM